MLKEKVHKVFFFVCCALSAFPLLSVPLTSAVIILLIVVSISSALTSPGDVSWNRWPELLAYSLPFWIILLWVTVFDRSAGAYYYLERSLSLLVFPLAFFLIPFRLTSSEKRTMQTIFIAATCLMIAYGGIMVAIKLQGLYGENKPFPNASEMMQHPSFSHNLRSGFEESTGFHPTYVCLFLGISFIWALNELAENWSGTNRTRKVLFIALLGFLLVAQVTLASRTPFIGTMLSSFLLFIYHQKKKINILWAGVIMVAVTALLFVLVPSFSARLREISLNNLTLATAANNDSFNIRTGIYKCSVEIIRNNWLAGIGPGHTQQALNDCYSGISAEVYEGREYNTHNQYLDYWIGMGIAAPLALVFMLIFVSYKNLLNRDTLPLCFCMLFFIAMLTENILVRQGGVIAFSFVLSFYIFTGSGKDESRPVKY